MARSFLETAYHLTRIPFELGRYNVERIGREEEWAKLTRLIDETRAQRGPKYIVLLGTYGAGKSFLLWQLYLKYRENTARERVLTTRPVRLLDPEQSKDIVRNLIVRVFKRGLDVEKELVPIIKAALKRKLPSLGELDPYLTLLAALAKKETLPAARRVLHGGRILRSDASRLGIPDLQQIKTNEEAVDLLLALQIMLRIAGYELMVLSIDEVEYIDQASTSNQGKVFDSLKELFDRQVSFASGDPRPMPVSLAMILAATPSFWQDKAQLVRDPSNKGRGLVGLTPFFDRVPESNIVEMAEGLTDKEARQLIASRMAEARVGAGSANGIIPFTQDYVTYIYELSHGRPRRIIEICDAVVSEAVRRELKTIDRKAAQAILRDLLITYEPVDHSKANARSKRA